MMENKLKILFSETIMVRFCHITFTYNNSRNGLMDFVEVMFKWCRENSTLIRVLINGMYILDVNIIL